MPTTSQGIADDMVAAVRKAWADYLRTQIGSAFGTDSNGNSMLVVREKWPQNRQVLADYDVTVLATGEADDWWLFPPSAKKVTAGAPPNGTVTYSYGFVDGLQLDMDCFAATQDKRSALAQQIRAAMNQPPWVTAPAAIATPKFLTLGHQPGVVLQLTTFFSSLCEYEWSPISAPVESAEAAQVGEWRAHYRGRATLFIRDQQLFTLMKRLIVTVDTGAVSHTKTLPNR